MSVIIRLQNLPWSANAHDIREFFKGLAIPEGGVHIVGGELGDAFIAFSSDEDARLAMQKTGGSLKGTQISLLLSSRSEMQKVIETARQQAMGLQAAFVAPPPSIPQPTPTPTIQQGFHQPPPVNMQVQPQRMPPVIHDQPDPNQLTPPQQAPAIMYKDVGLHQQPHNLHPFNNPYGNQPSPFLSHPMPFQGQRPTIGNYPSGVITANDMSNQFMSHPMNPSVGVPLANHLQNSEGTGSPSNVPLPVFHSAVNQIPNFPPPSTTNAINPTATPPFTGADVTEKKEKKPQTSATSTTSSSNRDKREKDSKGRDDRRRRSKSRSRSRSRDRDRRRRHRTRSRSRSRDRGGRRRRSRSRERERTREKERERQREKDKDKNRSHRDRPEKTVTESEEGKMPRTENTSGGIPGLGEIPDDIPKEGLSIFAAPSNTVLSDVPLTSSGWPRKELPTSDKTPKDMDIEIETPPIAPSIPSYDAPNSSHLLGSPPRFFGGVNEPVQNTLHPTMGSAILDVAPPPYQNSPQNFNDERIDVAINSRDKPTQFQIDRNSPAAFNRDRREWGPGSYDPRGPRGGAEEVGSGGVPARPQDQWRNGSDNDPRRYNDWNRNDFEKKDNVDDIPARDSWNRSAPLRGEERPFRDFRDRREPWFPERGERNDRMDRNTDRIDRNDRMDRNDRVDRGNRIDRNERVDYPYSSRNTQFQDDYRSDYGDSFGRGGFRGRGRRGGFMGREGERETDASRGPMGFREENSSMRDRFSNDNDMGYRGRGRGFMRGRLGRPPMGQDYPPRDRKPKTRCIEILHLPSSASYKAIRDHFMGIPVPSGGIKILGDQQGRRIGVALIQFATPRDAYEAFKMTGTLLHDSNVEINFIDEDLYYDSRDISRMQEPRDDGRISESRDSTRTTEVFNTTGSDQGPINEPERGLGIDPQLGIIDPELEPEPEVQPLLEMDIEAPEIIESPCIYVSGLPIGCTDHDVARVFDRFKVEDVVLELEKGSRQPSGGCFVRLSSPNEVNYAIDKLKNCDIDGTHLRLEICLPEAMDHAIKERNKINNFAKNINDPDKKEQKMGSRSTVGRQTSPVVADKNEKNSNGKPKYNKHDYQGKGKGKVEDKKMEAKDKQDKNVSKSSSNKITTSLGADLLTDSVVIKNVTSDVTETSIRDFFSDEGLIPEKIYFNKVDSLGKCDVFVVFPKIENAARAVGKSNQQLGASKIVVELISKPTVMLAMGLPFNPLELFQKSQRMCDGVLSNKDDKPRSKPLLPNPTPNDTFIVPQDTTPPQISPIDNEPDFRGRGHSRYSLLKEPSYRSFRNRNPTDMRNGPDVPYSHDRSSFSDRLSKKNILDLKSAAPPADFGQPGCVVALKNVPFQATTEDILQFFKDFPELIPENIIRRYDEKNRPTSDSRVCLTSPEDAMRAIELLNRKLMLSRPIYMSIVN